MDGRHRQPVHAGWRLSLILPAYNEAAGIRQAIEEADDALNRLFADYEILIVDDGSHDATSSVTLEAARTHPHVRLLRHEHNRGYGAALRTGFESARFDRVAFTDADCQFDLADLASLVPLTDCQPVAVGYRIDRQDPWKRRFVSWGYNTLVRGLLGTRVRDCDCALKVFRKDALAHLLPQNQGYFVNTEMLTRARQLGYDVAETGVRHRPRLRGESKVSLWDIPRTLRSLLPFWWSEVLFPGPQLRRQGDKETGRQGDRETGRQGADESSLLASLSPCLLVLILAAMLFFTRLSCPLLEPDEARYAEIPRQMLAEGRLLVPVLHGQPYYDKPPLLYWLVMGSYRLCGVHDWAARLVPCLAAFLTVLVTYVWGRPLLGNRAAFLGALVLCLSSRFVYLGRMLSMDSLLCLWVVSALAAAHLALRGSRLGYGWWLSSAVCCGLGLLTKGPVALILVGVPIFAYSMLDGRTPRLRIRAWLVYLAVALGLAMPWYAGVAAVDPEFVDYFFWRHNILRYVAPFDHKEPVWFFVPSLLLGMLPWTLLLPALFKFLLRRSARAASRRPAALGLPLLAGLWCFLFYSLSGCKRPGYILPVMPPLALALGWYLHLRMRREKLEHLRQFLSRSRSRYAYQATVLMLVLGVGASLVAEVTGLFHPLTACILAGTAGAGLLLVHRQAQQQRPAVSWALCSLATFVVLLAGVHQLLPAYTRKFSLRGQVRPHFEVSSDPGVPVACYPRRWDSVSFYLQRNDVRVYRPEQRDHFIADLRAQSGTLVFVKSGAALRDLLRDLPASLEFVQRGRQGNVTVGWVQPRATVPDYIYAGR